MGISEDVLRCLVVELEEKKRSVKPRPVRRGSLWPRLPKLSVEAAPAAAQPAETSRC